MEAKKQPVWTPETIKKEREERNLTQQEFGILVGTTQQRISEWERGLTPKNAWQRLLTVTLKANV